jgi:hypothetical protein
MKATLTGQPLSESEATALSVSSGRCDDMTVDDNAVSVDQAGLDAHWTDEPAGSPKEVSPF